MQLYSHALASVSCNPSHVDLHCIVHYVHAYVCNSMHMQLQLAHMYTQVSLNLWLHGTVVTIYAEAGQLMKPYCASINCHYDVVNDFAYPSTKFLGTPLSVCAWLSYVGGKVCFIDTAMFLSWVISSLHVYISSVYYQPHGSTLLLFYM